jgi:C-terminal processing protease CtpA/Prc
MKTIIIKKMIPDFLKTGLSIASITISGLLFMACSASKESILKDIDSAEKQIVINKICDVVTSEYVFPDIAEKCVNRLKEKISHDEYKRISNPRGFAIKVAEDLQAISKDKHFRVQVSFGDGTQPEKKNTPEDDFINKVKSNHFLKRGNYGFMDVKWYKGNIGYLDLRAFTAADIASEKAVVVMKFLSDMDAIIIDFRNAVRGGSPEMVALLCSYFLEKPTLYNTFYNRKEGSTTEEWTLAKIDGECMPDVPLYILTNKNVFSACEAFAYSLQALKRATVIGEPTKGGAHLTREVMLNDRFILTIPFVRAINPITGTNWEGSGVKPDIPVKSSKALDVALELAEKSAEEHRNKREENDITNAKTVFEKFMSIVQQFSQGEKGKALTDIRALLQEGYTSKLLTEEMINQAGYDLLSMELYELALEFFKFNVEKFPYSYNAYDSFGEAYMKMEETGQALINYKKSLEINPNNDNAKKMLEQLQK